MEYKFLIIDDDRISRRLLAKVIEQDGLGEIVGEIDTGEQADLLVMQINPDVVLVDMLLPGQDGVEITQALKDRGYEGSIVMISQVEDKEMVARAYQAGSDFYIHKPINRVEVLHVLRKVVANQKLAQSLSKVRQSLAFLEMDSVGNNLNRNNDHEQKMRRILRELGLAGGICARELQWLVEAARGGLSLETAQLKDLYFLIQDRYKKDTGEKVDIGTIEQRIRRAAHDAMEHLVALGKEDYHNPLFEYYAPRFFDYKEMRAKLRGGKAKVNLKKFITALCDEVNV